VRRREYAREERNETAACEILFAAAVDNSPRGVKRLPQGG
jgi:hypothetical protein